MTAPFMAAVPPGTVENVKKKSCNVSFRQLAEVRSILCHLTSFSHSACEGFDIIKDFV